MPHWSFKNVLELRRFPCSAMKCVHLWLTWKSYGHFSARFAHAATQLSDFVPLLVDTHLCALYLLFFLCSTQLGSCIRPLCPQSLSSCCLALCEIFKWKGQDIPSNVSLSFFIWLEDLLTVPQHPSPDRTVMDHRISSLCHSCGVAAGTDFCQAVAQVEKSGSWGWGIFCDLCPHV